MNANDLTGIGKVCETLEAATKEVRTLIYEFLSPAAKESGQFVGDGIRVARALVAAKMLTMAKQKLLAARLELKPVAVKILFPILEGCSLEEDEVMIDKWANLLSAAASSDIILPSYPRILSEISPQEARILDRVFQSTVGNDAEEVRMQVTQLKSIDVLNDDQFQSAITNLQRLRLLERKFDETTFLANSIPFAIQNTDLIGLPNVLCISPRFISDFSFWLRKARTH